MTPKTGLTRALASLWLATFASLPVGAEDTDQHAEARALFERVWQPVVDGDWPLDSTEMETLQSYPLWIDLQAARYSAEVSDGDLEGARQFLASAPDLAPVRRLRYRYVNRLAREARWARFFALYDQRYADHRDAALGCRALTAATRGHSAWSDTQIATLARRLWLTARSQHDACDTGFANLRQRGVITTDWFQERYALAINKHNFSLAGYLAKSIDQAHRSDAAGWKRLRANPRTTLENPATRAALSAQQIAYGIKRLALREPALAHELWHAGLNRHRGMTATLTGDVLRYLALAGAQDGLPEAQSWFADVPDTAADERLLAWRARSALRAADWPAVLRAVGRMPMAQASTPRWRYWEAIALTRSGQREAGEGLLNALAEDRSYHGFLAADAMDAPYRFDHRPIPAAESDIIRWHEDVRTQRVLELYRVDQVARARHELSLMEAALTVTDRLAIGAILHELGWHHEAIRMAAMGQHLDDLDIRFPLAHAQAFRAAGAQHDLEPTALMAVARSESLFDRTLRSSAGALGLMQLMPATARRTARSIGGPLPSTQALYEADVNIRLGSAYLAALLDQFGHRALAYAAYNAGEHRVERWIENPPSDSRIWIETIPYDETRDYVQKVMFANVVFQWRSNLAVNRISRHLTPVGAPTRTAGTPRL